MLKMSIYEEKSLLLLNKTKSLSLEEKSSNKKAHYGIWIDVNIWQKILKGKLGYSFERCSSRALNLNHKLQKLNKILFTVKLLKIVRRSTLLLNIDESVISHPTKSNYSWSRKGTPANLSTMILKGSISVVSAICSNGVSITGLRKGTITSRSFIQYIDHLFKVWNRL